MGPQPETQETWDPRESITWPKGWIDAYGVRRRVDPVPTVGGRKIPFRAFRADGEGVPVWVPDTDMGPLPHRRVP